jgi:hypothetical protein
MKFTKQLLFMQDLNFSWWEFMSAGMWSRIVCYTFTIVTSLPWKWKQQLVGKRGQRSTAVHSATSHETVILNYGLTRSEQNLMERWNRRKDTTLSCGRFHHFLLIISNPIFDVKHMPKCRVNKFEFIFVYFSFHWGKQIYVASYTCDYLLRTDWPSRHFVWLSYNWRALIICTFISWPIIKPTSSPGHIFAVYQKDCTFCMVINTCTTLFNRIVWCA